MQLTIEIIPGKSIGPFQLGMTFREIEETLASISSEPVTLKELEIVAGFRLRKEKLKATDRCVELSICVVKNQHTILLKGQVVNDISNEDAIHLFKSFAGKLSHSYSCFEAPRAGIRAVRWEHSDSGVDSIVIFPPRGT